MSLRSNTARINTEGQTPLYVAELLIERHFADLTANDLVLEPTCGRGAFLRAIPDHVPAIGIERDAALAAEARLLSGRCVIEGDITSVPVDFRPSVLLGNPPFKMAVIEAILRRAQVWLEDGGRVGMILPCSIFQTAATLLRFAEHWSIAQEMMPRNCFGHLRYHLCFATFTKERQRRLVGFALYGEVAAVNRLPGDYYRLFTHTPRPLWRSVVEAALQKLGGAATLDAIYGAIEGARPSANRFWREKVRQVLQRHFHRVGPGYWAVSPESEAA